MLDDQQGPVELWVNGVATTLGVGLLVLALRTRIESLLRTLEQTARTDQLTGLPNRRAFDERLVAELARLDRSGDRVALLILDLDRFKQLNDTSGHLAGDEALRVVAGVIREDVQSTLRTARGLVVGSLLVAEAPEEMRPNERQMKALRTEIDKLPGIVSTTLLATLPTGAFPGVDTTDVYEFLEAHAPV